MLKFISLFILTLFVAGCSEVEFASHLMKRGTPSSESYNTTGSKGNFKVGKPYQIQGKTYHPREQYDYEETGIASWYGPGFHGKSTANGEKFNTREMTAAHRTLQMPSLVRVTNLDNGRSIVVRINDRGPFARNRIIDVSERGAELLGFKNNGTAKVRLQVLPQESLKLAEAAKGGLSASENFQTASVTTTVTSTTGDAGLTPVLGENLPVPVIPGHTVQGEFYPDAVVSQVPVRPTGIYIQAGSFSVYENALKQRDRMESFGNAVVTSKDISGRKLYRVRVGPLESVPKADGLLARMVSGGYTDTIIIVE